MAPLTNEQKVAIAASDAAQALRLAALAADADAAMTANTQLVADFYANKTAPASVRAMRLTLLVAGIAIASPGAVFARLFSSR